VILGGPGRLASLHLAAEHLARDRQPDQVVVVHDGTRPFTPPDLFAHVVAALHGHDAAWPAASVANAVLLRDDADTSSPWLPGRSSDVLACATPIATTLEAVCRAMAARTGDEGALITGLIRLGLDWATVPDSPLNFKVTTERDLQDAVAMLGAGSHGPEGSTP
jgi:2-C-methyl-D-erythritol 4-phosphate cytidylyltransferase/2-C-methyl-D-erythritol 2,4-cyclodiphosphate synthase